MQSFGHVQGLVAYNEDNYADKKEARIHQLEDSLSLRSYLFNPHDFHAKGSAES